MTAPNPNIEDIARSAGIPIDPIPSSPPASSGQSTATTPPIYSPTQPLTTTQDNPATQNPDLSAGQPGTIGDIILSKRQHEAYARNRSSGMSAVQAYSLAYPRSTRITAISNGGKLDRRPNVAARIAYLKAKRQTEEGAKPPLLTRDEAEAILVQMIRGIDTPDQIKLAGLTRYFEQRGWDKPRPGEADCISPEKAVAWAAQAQAARSRELKRLGLIEVTITDGSGVHVRGTGSMVEAAFAAAKSAQSKQTNDANTL